MSQLCVRFDERTLTHESIDSCVSVHSMLTVPCKFLLELINKFTIYVVGNFFSQVIFSFLLLLWMVISVKQRKSHPQQQN